MVASQQRQIRSIGPPANGFIRNRTFGVWLSKLRHHLDRNFQISNFTSVSNEGAGFQRLKTLDSYNILDTPAEQGFDDIVLLASQFCETPVALVSLVAGDRQWFKARIGFDPCETPLSQSVCKLALERPGLLIIPDLTLDGRTRDNTLVTSDPKIRFYAGARLEAPNGDVLGMLCVIDVKARPYGLTDIQCRSLEALARQVMSQLELHRGNVFREKQLQQLNSILREEVETRTTERDLAWKNSRDLQVVLDGQGIIEAVNDAWTNVLGWTSGEIIGQNHLKFTHPDFHSSSMDALEQGLREGLAPYETRFLHKDGSTRWISWVASSGGDIVFASGRDVTAEKQQAVELAESTAELHRLWQTSPDLLVVIDFDGILRKVNPAWSNLLGYDATELVGHHVNEFILSEDTARTTDAYELAAAGGEPKIENRYRHKDGSVRFISWVAAPSNGLTYATGRDVTADHEAAAKLASTQDALRQSQKMEAVGQLTGGLAHDFNNLLAVITGSLELAERGILKGQIRNVERYMASAQSASKRAASLTHRLLAFSRRQTLDPRRTDVNKLVAGIDDLVRRTVGPEIEIEVVGAGGLWTTFVDQHQLENAILNLCNNARDAMPDGGRLTIETANRWLDDRTALERDIPSGQYVSLCVSDTGQGMPAEVIAKAFDPFFTTKPIGKGTGLGLSMVYGFARQSGGQVRIYSEAGQGTMVCIYFPRSLGDENNIDAMALERPDRAMPGETVLIVDDEPGVRMLVVEVLTELGYNALEAADGPSAMKIMQSNVRIDLLVTDVGLPGGLNGRQVADAGRQARPNLNVLFITGYAENAAVGGEHLDPGMAVMTKPFAMNALANKIKELIVSRSK